MSFSAFLAAVGSAALGVGQNVASSYGGGLVSSYFGNKNDKKAMRRALDYQHTATVDSPSWTREGLEKAGYNPMLAVGGDAFVANGGFSPTAARSEPMEITPLLESISKKELPAIAKAERETAVAEATSAKEQAKLDKLYTQLSLEAFGEADWQKANGSLYEDGGEFGEEWQKDQKARVDYKQMIRNMIEKDRYIQSVEHAYKDDAVMAVHGLGTGLAPVFSAFQTGNSRHEYRRRK